MHGMAEKTIVVDCVGREFSPGMLYDYTTDSPVPGLSLWEPATIKSRTEQRSNPYTYSKLHTSSSFIDKCNQLDISASLKCSFLSGLVELQGSASYIKDTRSHSSTESISFVYRAKTYFKEFFIKQPVDNPNVFDMPQVATHVVTGVLYGGNAILTFEQKLSSSNDETHVSGNLEAKVKMALASIEGSASVDITETDKSDVNSLSVTYNGDFHLDKSPITFSDGLEVVRDLPKLIANGSKPMKVYLFPLHLLDSRASQLVREISDQTVSEAGMYYDVLSTVINTASGMMEDRILQNLSNRQRLLERFVTAVQKQRSKLAQMLADKLPQVRATGEGEHELLENLAVLKESMPVSIQQMQQWVDDREGEVIQLITRITALEGNSNAVICFKTTEREKRLALRPDIPKIVVSVPTTMESPLLSVLEGGLPRNTGSLKRDPSLVDSEELQDTFYRLSLFAETNKRYKTVDILITEAPILKPEEKAIVSARIHLVASGRRQFYIPSAPTRVDIISTGSNGATVSWSPPKYGHAEVTGYTVSVHGHATLSNAEWKTLKFGPDERVAKFDNLQCWMKMHGSVQAVTVAGKSPLSTSTNSIKTGGVLGASGGNNVPMFIVAWHDIWDTVPRLGPVKSVATRSLHEAKLLYRGMISDRFAQCIYSTEEGKFIDRYGIDQKALKATEEAAIARGRNGEQKWDWYIVGCHRQTYAHFEVFTDFEKAQVAYDTKWLHHDFARVLHAQPSNTRVGIYYHSAAAKEYAQICSDEMPKFVQDYHEAVAIHSCGRIRVVLYRNAALASIAYEAVSESVEAKVRMGSTNEVQQQQGGAFNISRAKDKAKEALGSTNKTNLLSKGVIVAFYDQLAVDVVHEGNIIGGMVVFSGVGRCPKILVELVGDGIVEITRSGEEEFVNECLNHIRDYII